MYRDNKKGKIFSTSNLTKVAIMSAISAILFMIEVPIFAFYKLDLSNLPVMLVGFAMGPLAGIIVLFIKDLLGLLHSTSMGVGELADFITACSMLLPAYYIYKNNKSKKTALTGLVVGAISMTVMGIILNMYLIIPFYQKVMNFPVEAIIGLGQKAFPFMENLWQFVLLIAGPFNLLKGIVISALTFFLYKRLAFFLKEQN